MNHAFQLLTTLTLPTHFAGPLSQLCWSPNGVRLAAASAQGSIAVWDTLRGVCIFDQCVTRDPLTALAWTAQGRGLMVGSARGTLSLLHLASGEIVKGSNIGSPITRIACAPNEEEARFFVVAGPLLCLFTAGQSHPLIRRYATPLLDAAWCPAGRSIALLTRHGLVEVWDVAARTARFQAVLHNTPRCLTWGETDQALTIGTAQGQIQTYSWRGAHWDGSVPLSSFPLAALLRGKQGLIVCSAGETVLWSETVRHLLPQVPEAVALDPHGVRLASACARVITLATLTL